MTIRLREKPIRSLESTGSRSWTLGEWDRRIDHALRNLGDRSVLNASQLARLTYVRRLAEDEYRGHILPKGLALHDLLTNCIRKICTELEDEPGLTRACRYLELLVQGISRKEISRQLGLSREHVSRTYRKKAVKIVTEEFMSIIRNG